MISLETQGYRPEVLRVISPTLIQIGDQEYSVHDTGEDEVLMDGDVHVDVIAFDDPELAQQMDAAYIQVKPGKSTPIQHWSGSRLYMESIVEGSAAWIAANPEGKVVEIEFDAQSDNPGLILYGAGWTGSWVAGPEGVKFVEICIPPFEDDGTVLVAEPGDKQIGEVDIPLLFTALYYRLTNLDNVLTAEELALATNILELGGEIEKFLRPEDFGSGTFMGDDPEVMKLSPRERLFVSAWRHACPVPGKVSEKYSIPWARGRYDECNFVTGLIWDLAGYKKSLRAQLTSSTLRLQEEPVGVYEKGRVPESHNNQMSALSTLTGYALPRVLIEEMGVGENKTIDRYIKALELAQEAISQSTFPVELLVKLSEKVAQSRGNPTTILSHILVAGILKEENNREEYKKVVDALEKHAPILWQHYLSLDSDQRKEAGIIEADQI